MAEDSHPAAFIINLDRSRERLSAAASQLDQAGIDWQRISAIDGHAFDEATVARYDVATFARNVGRGISGSEIALHLSHMKATEAFLESGSSAGLIFEDDFVIDDLSTFKRVTSALMRCPGCWDIVKLSGVHRYSLPVKQACLVAPHVLAAPLLKLTGATCYLINRLAAAIILERLPPINDHFDHRLDQPWLFGLNYRIVHPFPVREAPGTSTINYVNRAAKFSAWQRRHCLYYRIEVGLLRLAYNAHHGFFLFNRPTMHADVPNR
jgi:GR25 family glycosyltransferase involved in LPS biosynthesis